MTETNEAAAIERGDRVRMKNYPDVTGVAKFPAMMPGDFRPAWFVLVDGDSDTTVFYELELEVI